MEDVKKKKRLKQVLVKLKKITIFPVGEHVGANLFIEQECGLGPIRGIGAHISCAFLHKKRNRIFSDKVYMYSSCFK